MPFLLAEILNYQCALHLKGVGSLSIIITKQFLTKIQLCILCKFHGLLQNIDILQVERQAEEYNTGIIRELSYMTVHSFYHLMGEDHMEEEDKKVMRKKEENVLKELGELCK